MPKRTLIILATATAILGTFRSSLSEFRPSDSNLSNFSAAGSLNGRKEEYIETVNFNGLWKTLWLDHIPKDLHKRPWNMTKLQMNVTIERLQSIVEGKLRRNMSDEISTLFQTMKIPSRPDSMSLYNETTYHDLISTLLRSHTDGRHFTIVACGASTTAGGRYLHMGGGIPKQKRYYSKLADYLNALLPPTKRKEPTVLSLGQGHGSRKSLHTAIFYDSFIPSNTDLIIWEFSVNDGVTFESNLTKALRRCQLNLLAFLHEVGSRKYPPKVMLVYYWNTPYATRYKKIGSTAFAALGDIGRHFDFVVGHVHMAAYIEESRYLRCRIWQTCLFLGDKHHASEIGHLATSFLLLNLFDPSKHSLLPPPSKSDDDSDLYKHEWYCGTETPEKQLLQKVVTNSSTGWKSPLGAWTLELPVTEDYSSARRLIAGQSKMDIHVMGKQDPMREDRQQCTNLTYCGHDPASIFSVLAPLEPMKDVQVMLLNFSPGRSVLNSSDISVHINNSSKRTNGTIVPVRAPNLDAWHCHFGWSWGPSVDTYWYIFEEPMSAVNSVGLCTLSNMTLPPLIQSLAFW